MNLSKIYVSEPNIFSFHQFHYPSQVLRILLPMSNNHTNKYIWVSIDYNVLSTFLFSITIASKFSTNFHYFYIIIGIFPKQYIPKFYYVSKELCQYNPHPKQSRIILHFTLKLVLEPIKWRKLLRLGGGRLYCFKLIEIFGRPNFHRIHNY